MNFSAKLDSIWQSVHAAGSETEQWMERIRSEIELAQRFADHRQDKTSEWQGLIAQALEEFAREASGSPVDLPGAVKRAEAVLASIGEELKQYTIHCCGHAHIDMNWLWPWQETVSTTHDTFATVNRLMEEFPEFQFSQDQASTYLAMEEHCPEIFEMIRERVRQGRWDVTASTWVEGEKNLASGEILCRHLLYTRRYFKERMGLPYEAVTIDWEPDMFGHSHMLPAILTRGGVRRYYFCRGGKHPKLFWWEAPDGSRVLTFQDDELWYNGTITPDMTRLLFSFETDSRVRDYLFLYGVGDHGGGPTRQDLVRLMRMQQWPIYPTLRPGKVGDFFDAVEAAEPDLPVINDELNFVFEGCYTSQSNVKRGNRQCENALPQAETIAVIAGALAGMPYPADQLSLGWRHTMFNQFHDILPGSGIHATYEYAQGLYQTVLGITESVSTRGLRRLAEKVDTASVAGAPASDGPGSRLGDGVGAGAGDPGLGTGISGYNTGAPGAQPFLVYNPMAWERSDLIQAKVWNTTLADDRIVVKDAEGNRIRGQVLGRGNYWGHSFVTVGFPAQRVPGTGYKVYAIDRCVEPVEAEGVKTESGDRPGHSPAFLGRTVRMENEHLFVEIERASGAITSLVDKASGVEFVPGGERLGLLEMWHEAHHGMTAWVIGQITRVEQFTEDGTLEIVHRGPHRAAVVSRRKYADSSFSLEIGLNADSRRVDFRLTLNWLERGHPERGVPMLKASFPLAVQNPRASSEIPFGSIERPTNGQEVPALKWMDLSGDSESGEAGLTLVNLDKYGHGAEDNVLRLTLLRSSYDPDPLPELGAHTIQFAIIPHIGPVDATEATRQGWAFNAPMLAVSADSHSGTLPAELGFISVEPANVMLTAAKKPEDAEGILLRLYEIEGTAVEAAVKLEHLAGAEATVEECDLLEQKIESSTARMEGGTLRVPVPAHGIVTVKVL